MASNYVFVVDTHKVPQTPIHPARARQLLTQGQAAVWKRYPFTLILRQPGPGPLFIRPQRLKIDPGSKTTGLALLDGARVLWAGELEHRGQRIKAALESRRALRRGRRQRKTRYRPPRFLHRTRPAGWLAPSLQHRVLTTMTWVRRLQRICPLTALSMELVRFDLQQMLQPEIQGVEYQQGELWGYEVKEYLLEKWGRRCAYCGAQHTPLEVEHLVPRRRGGSNRVSNLTLACVPCNQKKGTQTAEEFGFPDLQKRAHQPLRDAAAINSTRWALFQALRQTGLPVECGSGGRTKANRHRLHLKKAHWIDAACVGASTPAELALRTRQPLRITAMGHGKRQMCLTDKYGFPKAHRQRQKRRIGLYTGDIIRAQVPSGKYQGVWVSRVVVRAQGSCGITVQGKPASVHPRTCTVLWRRDGYAYR